MRKTVNIQTVDAAIERLENANSLSTNEEFMLDVLNKLQAYQSQTPKFYDVYARNNQGEVVFHSRISATEKPTVADGYTYVGLVEIPQ